MSRNSGRNTLRIDYKMYSKTGQKVEIGMIEDKTPEVKIKLKNVEIKELKAEDDITYFLCIYYKPDEVASDDELTEGMNFALHLCQGYRHLHTELKILFGEEYSLRYPRCIYKGYPRFKDNLNKLTEFGKKC